MIHVLVLVLAGAQAFHDDYVTVRGDDRISKIQVQSICRKHHIEFIDAGFTNWGNTMYTVRHAPADFFDILKAEAPPNLFSLYHYQVRDFSASIPDDKWVALTKDQLAGKKKAPLPVADILKAANLKPAQVTSLRYFPRPYEGLDLKKHTGYEVVISGTVEPASFPAGYSPLVDRNTGGWTIRFQVYEEAGKTQIDRRAALRGL